MDSSNELNSPILPPEMEIAAFVVFICVACTVLTIAGIAIGLSCLWKKEDDPDSMTPLAKLEWVHFAIQEAQNGNTDELDQALELVEDLREVLR